jgi:hypothetical protein
LVFEARNRPVGLRLLSVRLLGGIAHLQFVRPSMGVECSLGLVPTGRISLLNELWT